MLVDSQSRKDSLELHSKLVKASAGTGKTSLLTNYFLKLLSVVEHPRQIQAMTFTNKASLEMSNRIIKSLENVQKGVIPKNAHEEENQSLAKAALRNSELRGWNLEKNTNMLQISTIDSFSKKVLLSQVGEQEGMLATQKISNDPHSIYEKAVKDTLELYSDEKYGPSIQKLSAHFGNKMARVEQLLVEMLETRDRWVLAVFNGKTKTKQALEAQRESFVESVLSKSFNTLLSQQALLQDLFSQLSINSEVVDEFISNGFKDTLCDNVAIIERICSLYLTSTKAPKKRFTVSDGVSKDLSKSDKSMLTEQLRDTALLLASALNEMSLMPSPKFKKTEWALLSSVFEVMPVLLAKLSMTFREFGEIDFTEVSLNAIQALDSESGKNTQHAINASQNIKHLLVDEFQDSNDTQMIMLRLLTDSWVEGDGNTLFLVGDAMQSLYGFRGANVNLFMQAEQGIGNVPIQAYELSTNFRSTVGVVKWVNTVFSKVFPAKNNYLLGASSYSECSAVKVNTDEESVEIHGFIDDNSSEAEAKFIVEHIEDIQRKEPSARIAVIGRTRTSLAPVLNELDNTKIKSTTVDIKKIDKEYISIVAIALARVLIDDLDKLAWVTLMNSGLVGLTHKTIESILKLDKDPYLAINSDKVDSCMSHSEFLRFDYVMQQINFAIDEIHHKDFSLLLSGLWLKIHGPSLAINNNDMANVKTIFNIFSGVDASKITLAWLDRKLDKIYSRTVIVGDDNGAVNIELMTVHRAKGLEFDYVFIPGMHKQGAKTDNNLISWSSLGGEDDPMVMACSESLGIKALDVGYHKFLSALKSKREYQELMRLVYVGVTRAIKKVYLTGKVKVKDECLIPPTKGSMFSILHCACAHEFNLHEASNDVVSKQISPSIKKIHADLDISLPVRNTLAAYRGPERTFINREGVTWQKPISKIEGIVIHEIIEQINRDGVEKWSDQVVDSYSSVILSSLKELSLEKEYLMTSTNKIKAKIKTLLSCQSFISLSSKHVKDDVELRMAFIRNKKINILQVDKGFIDEAGQGHVIDWKSASMKEGQSNESFVKAQKTRYKTIMNFYGEAYKELTGIKSCETSLYFTDTQQLEKVS